MLHDPALGTDRAPSLLDPRRAFEIEVWAHYIDKVLASPTEILPGPAARNLVRRLEEAGVATIQRSETSFRIQMLGVTASTSGGENALLRNWQSKAFARSREVKQ